MRRSSPWAVAGFVFVIGGVIVGCDDKQDVPPAVLQAQQNPVPATRPMPTTQELLTGVKKRLRLPEFPVSLDVPPSWGLQSLANGEIFTVNGQGSSGDFDIQLVQQSQLVPKTQPETMLAAAKKELAAKPHPINRAELHELGPVKVVEVRSISNAFVNGKLPAEVEGDILVDPGNRNVAPGVQTTTRGIVNPHMVKWTFTLFVPAREDKLSVRALTFMRLGLHDYEKDKDFLEQLMKSMKYEE